MGAIEQQSNYLFVYNKDVDVQRNASLNVEDRPLADVLADLFNGSGIRYSVEGSYIMLSAAKAADAVQQAITVTGKVMDGAFNEPMPGVAIQVQGTTTGTVTDLDGNFTLEVPSQDAVLIFSFVGNWNDFFGPSLYLTIESSMTLQLMLKALSDARVDLPIAFAGAVITCIPLYIIYIIFQRYFIEGMAISGVKG